MPFTPPPSPLPLAPLTATPVIKRRFCALNKVLGGSSSARSSRPSLLRLLAGILSVLSLLEVATPRLALCFLLVFLIELLLVRLRFKKPVRITVVCRRDEDGPPPRLGFFLGTLSSACKPDGDVDDGGGGGGDGDKAGCREPSELACPPPWSTDSSPLSIAVAAKFVVTESCELVRRLCSIHARIGGTICSWDASI